MTSPEGPEVDWDTIDWDTIERAADKGELSRLESLSDKELEEELRRGGIDPEKAHRIVREELAKAGYGKAPASAVGLRVVGGTGAAGEKTPVRSGRVRVWAWVSGSVATMAAAAGVVMQLMAGPELVSQAPPDKDARELRAEAAASCEKQAWEECARMLDKAREIDPGGEKDSRVVEERKAIAEHLR